MRGIAGALVWMVGGGAVVAAAAFFLLGGEGGEAPDLTLPAILAAPTPASAPKVEPPRPNCPPPLTTPGRNPSMPVDDVFGVRPGVTVQEAQALILCRSERFEFQFEPLWHTPLSRNTQSQRQIMQARRPGESIVVGLVGPLGQERVGAVWRDESFSLSAAPSVQTLAGELASAFGPPHEAKTGEFSTVLTWSYTPDGRPMAEPKPQPTGLFARMQGMFRKDQTSEGCVKNARLTWLDAPTWSDVCGVTIQASIEVQLDDRARASRLRVAVIDQALLAREVAAFRAQVTAP